MVEILPFSRYRNVYDASRKECPATDTLQPLEEIIGQERALRALSFGLENPGGGVQCLRGGHRGDREEDGRHGLSRAAGKDEAKGR